MGREIKNLVKQVFRKLGYDLRKINQSRIIVRGQVISDLNVPLPKNRLANLVRLGFDPDIVVDGGAHIGNWTKMVSEFLPNSKYILIEPNPIIYSRIDDNLSGKKIDYTIIKKALGAQKGNMELNIWENVDSDLTGSSLCEHVRGEATKKINCELIDLDSIIDIYKQAPDFIKLDLQGFELQALQGAKEILKSAELMIIEFGCLDAYINRTSVRDLIDIMYENSYCLYDVMDLNYRPFDNALTAGDFIFVKRSSKLRQYKGWE